MVKVVLFVSFTFTLVVSSCQTATDTDGPDGSPDADTDIDADTDTDTDTDVDSDSSVPQNTDTDTHSDRDGGIDAGELEPCIILFDQGGLLPEVPDCSPDVRLGGNTPSPCDFEDRCMTCAIYFNPELRCAGHEWYQCDGETWNLAGHFDMSMYCLDGGPDTSMSIKR